MWRKTIPAKKIQDGSEGTIVLQLGDVTVGNTYLPCRGKYGNQEFIDEVDQLDEICSKFADTLIILTGDMNVDIIKHPGTRTDRFKELMSKHCIVESLCITMPTYHHHDGKSNLKIDYILIPKPHSGSNKGIYIDFCLQHL